MDDFVNNFYNVSQTHPLTHEDSGLSLVYVKYILDILSPLFIFTLQDGALRIKDVNGTRLTTSMYTYYMQFRAYPDFKKYLQKMNLKCQEFSVNQNNQDVTSFPPPPKLNLLDSRYNHEVSFEDIQEPLQKYFNITKDPRQLIQGHGQKIIIIKEPWTNYLKNLIPECNDYDFKNIKQIFPSLCNLFTSNENFLKLLKMYLGGGSNYEKSNYGKVVLDSKLDV